MNREQLEFFYSEIMGLFGWGDEEEETGVDPLTWAREQLAQLRKEVVTWKNAERLALETVAQLRAENDELKAYYNRIMDETCGDEVHCTCVPILKRELDKKDARITELETAQGVAHRNYTALWDKLAQLRADLDLSNKLSESDGRIIVSLRDIIKRLRAELGKKDAALEEARDVMQNAVSELSVIGHNYPSSGHTVYKSISAWLSAHPAQQEDE